MKKCPEPKKTPDSSQRFQPYEYASNWDVVVGHCELSQEQEREGGGGGHPKERRMHERKDGAGMRPLLMCGQSAPS